MNSLKIILGTALTMAISGCGLARVYCRVNLGEPLRTDLGLTEVVPDKPAAEDSPSKGARSFGMMEYYVWHTPLTTSVQNLTIVTDPDLTVLARRYDRMTVTNALLIFNVSSIHTTEVIVPDELVADPAGVPLSAVLPPRYFPDEPDETPEKAGKAMTLTGGFNVVYVAASREHDVNEYMNSIPLAPALAPGYRKTFPVKFGEFITVSNMGDNRLHIESHVHLTTDLTAYSMFPIICLEEQLFERPPAGSE